MLVFGHLGVLSASQAFIFVDYKNVALTHAHQKKFKNKNANICKNTHGKNHHTRSGVVRHN